jgi:1,4-alpha-glucan branching enzyme
MHRGAEDLFAKEHKLHSFLRDVSGYSEKDKEINDDIYNQTNRQSRSLRESLSRLSQSQSQARILEGRNSRNSLNRTQSQTANSKLNFIKELDQHREKINQTVNPKQAKSTASLREQKMPRSGLKGHATIKEQSCEFSRDSTAFNNY